jgi:hypothetical protein
MFEYFRLSSPAVFKALFSGIMVMRTYALYERQKWVLILYGAIAILCIGLGAVSQR